MMRTILLLNTLVGCGAILILGSHPGRDLFDGWFFLATFAVCAVIQIGATLIIALVPKWRSDVRAALVMLVVFITAALVSRTLWPLRGRVLLSEPWLRRHAALVLASRSPSRKEVRVGLFRIYWEGNRDGAAYLSTGSYGMFGQAGLVFAPNPAHLNSQRAAVTHERLYGPWWRYSVVGD